jgi:NAD-dependent SIR2 family protein deacetylase
MSYCIPIKNGILTMVDVDFKCPNCEHEYEEKDWYPQIEKSKTGLIYKKCKGCGKKLGITTDMKGDVQVWLKENEQK